MSNERKTEVWLTVSVTAFEGRLAKRVLEMALADNPSLNVFTDDERAAIRAVIDRIDDARYPSRPA